MLNVNHPVDLEELKQIVATPKSTTSAHLFLPRSVFRHEGDDLILTGVKSFVVNDGMSRATPLLRNRPGRSIMDLPPL